MHLDTFNKIRILIVDDNPVSLLLLEKMLVQIGFAEERIFKYNNAKDALSLFFKAAKSGINGYLIKPLNTHTLKEKLSSIFAS